MDELRSAFDAATEGISVPHGDLAAVMRRGTGRRRLRIAGGAASVVVVAALAWAGVAVTSDEVRPVPAGPGEVPRLRSRLVPVVIDGPAPPPDLASPEDLAEARAVTVAFHALLGAAPTWHLAYEGVERSDDAWKVRFVHFTPMTPVERELRKTELETLTSQLELESHELELEQAADRLAERLEEERRRPEQRRDLRRALRHLQREAQRVQARVVRLQAQVAGIELRRRRLRTRQPSWPVVVTIVQREGLVWVDHVTTDSPDAQALRAAAGYRERTSEIDAWGYDYFRPRFREGVEVLGFWTGPLPAPYEERCRPQVLANGRVVWTQPRPDDPPGTPEHWEGPPPSEDRRDGVMLSFGSRYDGDPRDLSLRMLCEWRVKP